MKSKPYLNLVFTESLETEDESYKLVVVHCVENYDNPFITENKPYSIVEGHKIFLLPGCLIDKKGMEILNKKYGLIKTQDINEADVIIRPKKLQYFVEKRVITTSQIDGWNSDNIRALLKKAENYNSDSVQQYLNSRDTIDLIVPITHSNGTTSTRHNLNGTTRTVKGFFVEYDITYYDKTNVPSKKLFIKPKAFEIKAPVHVDSDLLKKQINKKGMVFDEETFLNIGKMITSDDKEGKAMIIDLMTNADYDESALYILVLLKEYCRYFPSLEGSNRKPFKAMLGYFNIDPKRVYFLEIDDITNSLKSIGKYDQKHMEELLRVQKHLIAYTMGLNTVAPKASCIDDADEIEL